MTASSGSSGYIAGAHLFGSASPINFWDTFRLRELDESLDAFVADGFNAVLLLVPWAQFQHSINPIKYNAGNFDRLDRIFDAAHKRNLKVILRIGYLWEPWPSVDPTHQRYREFFMREDVSFAWRAFNAQMYRHVASKPNFAFAFLSWEDFYWPILIWGGSGALPHRIDRARQSGYRDFVRRRFTLAGLKKTFNLDVQNWNVLAIPTKDEPAYELFLRFYEEEILARITAMAIEAFPGLRFEQRIDPDWIPVPQGKKFYHWSMNQWGPGSKVIYYHANIGQPSDRKMDTATALAHLEQLLQSYTRNLAVGEEKVFIDQFNFFDNTYAKWSQIQGSSVPEFLEKSADLLEKYTMGYAVWGFKDWRKDILYNGSFELGAQGWELAGGAKMVQIEPGNQLAGQLVELTESAQLTQRDMILKLGPEPKHVSVTGVAVKAGQVRVDLGGQALESSVAEGDFAVELEFDVKALSHITILSIDAHVRILKVQVYDKLYSQGLLGHDGSPTPASEAVARLNKRLLAVPPQ